MSNFFRASTLDDLMNDILTRLLDRPFDVTASKGTLSEIFGVHITLTNPRARLSRTETRGKPFSALGEFLWYLSANNSLEFIEYYLPRYKQFSDDGTTVYGGYGPRLFKMHKTFDQIKNIIDLLRKKPTSRQATVQIFDAEDIAIDRKDVPCTCTLQFLIREGVLHMITYMRSNDVIWGLPHDIFSFTMIQEIVARSVGVELGTYIHMVGSLHLYDNGKGDARAYLGEGIQSTKNPMPPMPEGDPWSAIFELLTIEEILRTSFEKEVDFSKLDQYWRDLALLLKVFALHKKENGDEIRSVLKEVSCPIYRTYIEKKILSS